MEDFRRQFLLDAVGTLETLTGNLRGAKTISDSIKRDALRTLHTIKGTAQTFGFPVSSYLAHRLEDLISAAKPEKVYETEDFNFLFLEGIEFLIKSFERKNFEIPALYLEKIQSIAPDTAMMQTISNKFPLDVPDEFVSQLSIQEKNLLRSALQTGKNLFCLEVGFPLSDFADKLISLREFLSAAGEIIATLPSKRFSTNGQIGFQILFASAVQTEQIEKIAGDFDAEIILNSSAEIFANDLHSVLSKIVAHGKIIAEKLGKKIRFENHSDETNLSTKNLKLVFEILLHLTRNAVDHGISANEGSIKISLTNEKDNLHLAFKDDGDGIDLDKLKATAIEKNLLADGEEMTEIEILDLIFAPEFSTKTDVTEISGRGIGLNAVKSAIEKSGGEIKVESERGKGTTFDIFLPR